jgi:hypothetical protein
MQMLANWRDLSADEAKAKLLAELFPARETVKSASGAGGSITMSGEAGDTAGLNPDITAPVSS